MNRAAYAVFSFSALALVAAVGCSEPALDPKLVAEHRAKLTLAEEPDGAQTVLDVRNAMYGKEAEEESVEADAAEESAESDVTAVSDEVASDEHAHEEGDEHDHAAHEHGDHDHADHDHEHGGHDHAGHDHDEQPVIDELDVVMVGTVGGVANPSEQSHPEFPFDKRQAVIFVADPEAAAEMEEHSHSHAPGEECSFCAAHAADSAHLLAVVQFKDKNGKPLRVDARDLFELKEKETVVVRGTARIAPGGMLTVDATGLYVRR